MNTWKDVTSYSRGDTDRTPRSWELKCGLVKVVVTRWLNQPGWFLTCSPFCDLRELGTENITLAKEEALVMVSEWLVEALAWARRSTNGRKGKVKA